MSVVKICRWLSSIATLLVVVLPIATASFDFFKLSIQWPPAFKYPGFTPSPLNFTIHGLWPHNFTTTAPLPCKAQAPYTWVTGPLLGRLQKSWPNVRQGTQLNQKFWEHEWDSHGGCSETTYNQMAYLTLAADLNDKHNILLSLRAANITRGASASLLAFEQAIKSHTTKWPELACRWDKPLRVLWEVRICYDSSSLAIIDCPLNQHPTICSTRWSGPIYFP
ncbi:hypothetical protein Vadar_022948 [Vaccinium darrowii]|uniref:Uncharacterized protein n=1 Tax=Vaccinium darrowii TaxID=229202 RepID=A0ACB7Y120_9ERIC|nr:hypothetical protein Vadar_022948 [Vaccinium darrowii]